MSDAKPYELFVPAAGTRWLNANDRGLWMSRHRITRAWRQRTAYVATAARLPRLDGAHIVCELQFADNRRRDPANWAPTAKACVDGLVDARVFDDDNSSRVVGPDMRIGAKVIGANVGVKLLIHPLQGPGADERLHDEFLRGLREDQP